jgi:hypothetical protein
MNKGSKGASQKGETKLAYRFTTLDPKRPGLQGQYNLPQFSGASGSPKRRLLFDCR